MRLDKKLQYIAVVLSALLVLVCGCGREREVKWRVGVSQPCSDEWRDKMNDEIRREMLFNDSISVEFRSADNESRKQMADLRHFIDSKVDLIIVAPNEAQSLTPIIEEAYRKGIAVVTFDRNVYGTCYTQHFEPDNVEIGHQAALYADVLFPGHVRALEIRGLEYSTPAQQRHEGFQRGKDSIPGFRLTSIGADWNAPSAARITDSVLRADPSINVIYAHNDGMAIAASKAAKALGRSDIKILGTDAAPNPGLRALADGLIDASFVYPTEGGRVFRSAVDILKGIEVPKEDRLGNNAMVDAETARILLRQNDLLKEETQKVEKLVEANARLGERNLSQKRYLWAMFASAALLLVLLLMLVIYIIQRHRYNRILADTNSMLEAEQEKQRDLYRQLDEATKAKLVFYTNVSHDLRTPLALVAGPVEKLAKSTNLSSEDRRLVGIAERNVAVLKRLIDQILLFRRYDNGKLPLEIRNENPARLLETWTASFVALAEERDIDFRVETDTEVSSLTIGMDVEKIERVVFNLLGNAFRFTPVHGSVTLRARLNKEYLEICVENTGSPIRPEDLKHIFERFYQGDGYSSGHSGIGLSLSKALVELHGGSIWAESKPGEPTRFIFTLPVGGRKNQVGEFPVIDEKLKIESGISEIESESSEPQDPGLDAPALILVVDDNPDLRLLVRSQLGEGFEMLEAGDGRQALALATRYVPDLIIADIMMPGMDGIELTRMLKEEITTSHIPILVLTACGAEKERLGSYRNGADGFLEKPIEGDILRARVINLLANRRRIQTAQVDGMPEPEKRAQQMEESSEILELESEFFRRFMDLLRRGISDSEFGFERVAAEMGFSQAQLSRKVKALTNYTPSELLRRMRLQKAHTLLLNSEKSISEITYECGFSSPAYFSKCFRDAYGKSPRQFREMN